ncbi:MAG TPA: CHRD domain-containing protein [Burkholderiales bacterium]|jgi:hypothetical protein|nr:CHRD domain-containing protein [Burkholderiales bacterium]
MKRSSFAFLLFAATMLVAAPASHAVVLHFKTHMDGPSEFPAVPSPGIGFATVDIDTILHTMDVHADWSGLVGTTTVAHIHCCVAPDAAVPTAGVATTTPTFPGFPAGVTAGTYDASFDLTMASSFNPAFVTAHGGTVAGAEDAFIDGLLAGQAYFNIHTTFRAGGEIRGFLVPEPGIIGLLGLGLGAAFMATRRRRG